MIPYAPHRSSCLKSSAGTGRFWFVAWGLRGIASEALTSGRGTALEESIAKRKPSRFALQFPADRTVSPAPGRLDLEAFSEDNDLATHFFGTTSELTRRLRLAKDTSLRIAVKRCAEVAHNTAKAARDVSPVLPE